MLNTDLGAPTMSDEELTQIYQEFLDQGLAFDDVGKWQLRRAGNTFFFPMGTFRFFFSSYLRCNYHMCA